MEDLRKTGLKQGLRQLSDEQIRRVLDYPGEMVLDTHLYHDGKFCPLAVGLGLDLSMEDPSDEKVRQELVLMGYEFRNTKGVPGEFYTTDRLRDLQVAAREVLEERIGDAK